MHGIVYKIATDGVITRTEIDGPPDLEVFKDAIGGGYLEPVPGFDIAAVLDGVPIACVAFCDEDGKGKNLELNPVATMMWDRALISCGRPGLRLHRYGALADYLVGPIAIVVGDDEFMGAL